MPAAVISIRKNQARNVSNKWQEPDDVFFHKSQVAIGTVLVYHGRLNHGSLWRVTDIIGYRAVRRRHLNIVESLSDQIELTRMNSNEAVKTLGFMYISYSSLWRISKNG